MNPFAAAIITMFVLAGTVEAVRGNFWLMVFYISSAIINVAAVKL